MSKVEEFRVAVNANEDWQEEVRNFGDDDNIEEVNNDFSPIDIGRLDSLSFYLQEELKNKSSNGCTCFR